MIDKLCAQHKAFFMPVSLALIGIAPVSRTEKLSPSAPMMTNEVPLGTKGARAPLNEEQQTTAWDKIDR